MKHYCYYCNQEIIKDITLVTFYTKKCIQCNVSYHLDLRDKIELIVLETTFRNKRYVITHDPDRNKTKVSQRREELVWKGNTAEILPIKLVEFDADYNAINPSNLDERLKTILTFL